MSAPTVRGLPAFSVLFLMLLSSLAGCAEPPRKEMDQAQGAIDTARAAGADRYATAELEGAVAALARADEAVLQRDYRQALSHALDARDRAQAAARAAVDRKADARSAAEREVQALDLSLRAADTEIEAIERRKLPAATTAPAISAVAAARQAMQEARTHLDAQRFDEAATTVREPTARLQAALADLAAASAAPPPPPPRRRPR